MNRKIHYRVVTPDGTTCPRCEQEAETRTHTKIGQKQLSQPFYFHYWYNCNNKQCPTKIFMLEDWKVWNRNAAAQNLKIVQEDNAWVERFKRL